MLLEWYLNEFLGDGADHDGHGLHRDSVIEQRRQVDYDTEGDVPVIAVSPGNDGTQDAVRLVWLSDARAERVGGALSHRRRRVSQVGDQLGQHRRQTQLEAVLSQHRHYVGQHPERVLAHLPFAVSQPGADLGKDQAHVCVWWQVSGPSDLDNEWKIILKKLLPVLLN